MAKKRVYGAGKSFAQALRNWSNKELLYNYRQIRKRAPSASWWGKEGKRAIKVEVARRKKVGSLKKSAGKSKTRRQPWLWW